MIEDHFTDAVVVRDFAEMNDAGGAPFPIFQDGWIGKGRFIVMEKNFREYDARGRRVKGLLFLPPGASVKEMDRVNVRGTEYEVIRVKAPGAGTHHLEVDLIEAGE